MKYIRIGIEWKSGKETEYLINPDGLLHFNCEPAFAEEGDRVEYISVMMVEKDETNSGK